jgi:hypothetical protein
MTTVINGSGTITGLTAVAGEAVSVFSASLVRSA